MQLYWETIVLAQTALEFGNKFWKKPLEDKSAKVDILTWSTQVARQQEYVRHRSTLGTRRRRVRDTWDTWAYKTQSKWGIKACSALSTKDTQARTARSTWGKRKRRTRGTRGTTVRRSEGRWGTRVPWAWDTGGDRAHRAWSTWYMESRRARRT